MGERAGWQPNAQAALQAGASTSIDRWIPRLGPPEAAIFETFVVPRYLSLFAELALEMIVEGEEAQLVHLFCRTGYPDRELAERLPGAHIYGCDPSPHAIELARAKAATTPGMVTRYQEAVALPVPLPSGSFSHALSLHPSGGEEERARILDEFARLLAPRGQALIAVPMRNAFQELGDLLREFTLKHEAIALGQSLDKALSQRPTPETLAASVERAGFDYVDVEQRATTIRFASGREFFEDPITRLLILPELCAGVMTLDDPPLRYLRDAIDKYWSDSSFELTLAIGCASGRRIDGA